ncbi:L antigen family member 3-like isoform X2 [Nerophis lumbriciformis]|uniref:L antigen family member 3-like isoform X2 n=1 Tax=Nerophis lumbriciformis TaxID=546530 RepID=UPI002ADF8FDD|nr:L antigen family member 3-like isoform X2 [Nerophis lumbriciformis]
MARHENQHKTENLELYPFTSFLNINYPSCKFPSPALSSLEVPFPSSRHATIALRSLNPDREPRKGGISKHLSVSGRTLSVRWSADEARILRVSVNSFLDNLTLVTETMQMFPTDT